MNASPQGEVSPACCGDVLLQEIDAAYAHRDDALVNAEGQIALSRALKERPASYEVLWRAARAKYWEADAPHCEHAAKKRLGRQGMELGARAIESNSLRAEGHCFYAVSVGMYAEAAGIVRAVAEGLDRKFASHIRIATEIDDAFADAMPRVSLGRYFCVLPWPKRDLGQGRRELERALTVCPHALRAELYLAEAYVKEGDIEGALARLAAVEAGSVKYDAPEGRRVKENASDMKRRLART